MSIEYTATAFHVKLQHVILPKSAFIIGLAYVCVGCACRPKSCHI